MPFTSSSTTHEGISITPSRRSSRHRTRLLVHLARLQYEIVIIKLNLHSKFIRSNIMMRSQYICNFSNSSYNYGKKDSSFMQSTIQRPKIECTDCVI